MLAFGGAWKGASVGDRYLGEVLGPPLGSSSMGVIGGGGGDISDERSGDETITSPLFDRAGRRERCDLRDGVGDAALPGVP
jgi:hypothetical protein